MIEISKIEHSFKEEFTSNINNQKISDFNKSSFDIMLKNEIYKPNNTIKENNENFNVKDKYTEKFNNNDFDKIERDNQNYSSDKSGKIANHRTDEKIAAKDKNNSKEEMSQVKNKENDKNINEKENIGSKELSEKSENFDEELLISDLKAENLVPKKIKNSKPDADIDLDKEENLKSSIDELINLLQNSDQNNLKLDQIKESLKDIEKSMTNGDQINKDLISKIIEKLKVFLENGKSDKKGEFELDTLLASLGKDLKKLTARLRSRKNSKNVKGIENSKDNLLKMENLANKLELVVSNGKENSKFADETIDGENKSNLTFNMLKENSNIDKKFTSGSVLKNGNFKSQLESLISRSKLTVQDNKNSKFAMKLYPRELGNINVNLTLENGVLHGKFLLESQDAKDLFMQNLDHIRKELEDAGIDLGHFDVDVKDNDQLYSNDNDEGENFISSEFAETKDIEREYVSNSSMYSESSINLVI